MLNLGRPSLGGISRLSPQETAGRALVHRFTVTVAIAATGGPGQSGSYLDLVRGNVQLFTALHALPFSGYKRGGQA